MRQASARSARPTILSILSDPQETSPPFFALSEHPRDERQQFLQGVEMGGLAGHHMFDPALYPPVCDVRAQAEVHDKGSVD